MDKEILVKLGQEFLSLLDRTPIAPRAAMWVSNPELDIWRLWIVPSKKHRDKQEFYRVVADLISNNRDKLQGLDIGSIELKDDKHPAIEGLGRFIRVEGISSAFFSNNRFNNFYLPDGIVLRMAI